MKLKYKQENQKEYSFTAPVDGREKHDALYEKLDKKGKARNIGSRSQWKHLYLTSFPFFFIIRRSDTTKRVSDV